MTYKYCKLFKFSSWEGIVPMSWLLYRNLFLLEKLDILK